MKVTFSKLLHRSQNIKVMPSKLWRAKMIVGPTIQEGLRQYLKRSKVKVIFSTTLRHLTDSWSNYPHKASLLPTTRARSSIPIRQCHQLTKKNISQNLNKMPSITNSSLTCLNNELCKRRKLETFFSIQQLSVESHQGSKTPQKFFFFWMQTNDPK